MERSAYAFERATDDNVHRLFRRLKTQCQLGRVCGAEPIVLEFLHTFALVRFSIHYF